MGKNLVLKQYVKYCKEMWEYKKLISINDDFLKSNNISREELFLFMTNEKIDFIKPFGLYYDEGRYNIVPDKMIYCEQFL